MVTNDHAPWGDAKFFQAGFETIETHHALFKDDPAQCPSFQMAKPRLVRDKGLEEELGNPDIDTLLFNSLPEFWHHKTPRVGPSRWYQYSFAVHRMISHAGAQYLGGVYRQLAEGHGPKLRVMTSVKVPAAAAEKRTSAEGTDVAALRRASKNTLGIQTRVYSDGDLWDVNRGIVHCLRPYQAAHSSQDKFCRPGLKT